MSKAADYLVTELLFYIENLPAGNLVAFREFDS
jgi:hypothetical protein